MCQTAERSVWSDGSGKTGKEAYLLGPPPSPAGSRSPSGRTQAAPRPSVGRVKVRRTVRVTVRVTVTGLEFCCIKEWE